MGCRVTARRSAREAIGTGLLRAGKIEWDDQRGFSDDLKLMKDGSVVVRVTLATPNAIRAVKLNRYYFGHVLRLIADYNGDDVEDLHAQMCARFLKRRIQTVNRRTGEMEDLDIVGRSSKLDPDEFWEFVLKVRLLAAEFFGVETQDPDPAWRERQAVA
jgi:hypothetical protein